MLGSKLPLFPYNRGWETQPNSRGLYTHYKDSLLKVGFFPSPRTKELIDPGSFLEGKQLTASTDKNYHIGRAVFYHLDDQFFQQSSGQFITTKPPRSPQMVVIVRESSPKWPQFRFRNYSNLPRIMEIENKTFEWWFETCLEFAPRNPGEMIQFDEHVFQRG